MSSSPFNNLMQSLSILNSIDSGENQDYVRILVGFEKIINPLISKVPSERIINPVKNFSFYPESKGSH